MVKDPEGISPAGSIVYAARLGGSEGGIIWHADWRGGFARPLTTSFNPEVVSV
jgi:hypothetical protein